MEKQKRSYSKEFKLKAVELSNLRGSSAQVASELDISPKNLSRWKQEYETGKLDGSNPKPVAAKSKEELENMALRKALREAELERDILKKAISIFSSNGVLRTRTTGKVQVHQGPPGRISCWEDVPRVEGKQERLLQMGEQKTGQT